jgi:hypothetical protein
MDKHRLIGAIVVDVTQCDADFQATGAGASAFPAQFPIRTYAAEIVVHGTCEHRRSITEIHHHGSRELSGVVGLETPDVRTVEAQAIHVAVTSAHDYFIFSVAVDVAYCCGTNGQVRCVELPYTAPTPE